jgi:hypothetical protein
MKAFPSGPTLRFFHPFMNGLFTFLSSSSIALFLSPLFPLRAQTTLTSKDPVLAEALVQRQIAAWNQHNAEDFIATYSDSTELYNFPDQLRIKFKGKQHLREYYTTLFRNNPQLNCEVLNQLVQGNTVVLQEKVSGWQNGKTSESIVIYQVGNGKITKVYFDSGK